MSEQTSRRLFLAQFIFLAAPALAAFVLYAVLIAGGAFSMLAAFAFTTLSSGIGPDGKDGAWSMLGMIGLAIVVPGLGLYAIVLLCRASLRFWRGGREALRASRSLFWKGIACGALPLALMVPIGFMTTAGGESWVDPIMGFYFSGIVLVPPIVHLGIKANGRSVAGA